MTSDCIVRAIYSTSCIEKKKKQKKANQNRQIYAKFFRAKIYDIIPIYKIRFMVSKFGVYKKLLPIIV